MLDRSFATVLRRLRRAKKISQEELGLEAHLHRTYISQLERGLKSPSLKTLHKLATVLGVSLTELINLVERENELLSDQQ